jgi:cysteine synthase B
MDEAAAMARALARQGLFVGPSSGGYLCGARAIARRGELRTIVTILNDGGERYGSTGLWSNGDAAKP